MSFDTSRFRFDPTRNFLGVVMQQGRVQIDSDWNEWVCAAIRRLHVGTMDTIGRAVVPREPKDSFLIEMKGSQIRIGAGRIYVDGILAENHGTAPVEWDRALAEPAGRGRTSFLEQPYLPFNEDPVPTDEPAAAFNAPAISAGTRNLVYLDVWLRDVTHLQAPEIVENAVGVDTTGRLQVVWQVKILERIGDADCETPDDQIPGWSAVTRPSAGRLTTSTGEQPGVVSPCVVPPTVGYKGLENQHYRVEIHRGGLLGQATFKVSRDNASVATRVMSIPGLKHLVVESVGRDDVLGFHQGDWIEVLDDWHELHGLPGVLRRIRAGDGVDKPTNSIFLEDDLPAGLFPVDNEDQTLPDHHTRIRRWDLPPKVYRADGSVAHDLTLLTSYDGIPVPAAAGTKLSLEQGIFIEFGVDPAGGSMRSGDNWVFTARTVDGSIELLDEAPPRGIHHHYARLAVVSPPDFEHDCRVLWPPLSSGESCDCTVCVHADEHNEGTATIQQAIASVGERGGTICLDAGTYYLRQPLELTNVQSLRIRGQGHLTVLQPIGPQTAMIIAGGGGVAIENLHILGAAPPGGATTLVVAAGCVDLILDHVVVQAVSGGCTAIGLAGVMAGLTIRDCTLIADYGLARADSKAEVFASSLRVIESEFFCRLRGINLNQVSVLDCEVHVADNVFFGCDQAGLVVTGGATPGTNVAIDGNVLWVGGHGVRGGVNGLRITNNEICGLDTKSGGGAGIRLEQGMDPVAIDSVLVTENRIQEVDVGVSIGCRLGAATITTNVFDRIARAGLEMQGQAAADHICVENNRFANVGGNTSGETSPCYGVLVVGAKRADLNSNVFCEFARASNASPLRVALATRACGDIRIAGNRMYGIGPAGPGGRTFGIASDLVFRHLAIDDNSIARVGETAGAFANAEWQAVGVSADVLDAGEPPESKADSGVGIPLKDLLLFLSKFILLYFPVVQRSVSVRGNMLRGHRSIAHLLEIDDPTADCRVCQNDGEAEPPRELTVGRIRARCIDAGHNRFIGPLKVPTLRLEDPRPNLGNKPGDPPDKPRIVVVGNVTSSLIDVVGPHLPGALPSLNIVIES